MVAETSLDEQVRLQRALIELLESEKKKISWLCVSEARRCIDAASIANISAWKTVGSLPSGKYSWSIGFPSRKVTKPAPDRLDCRDPSVYTCREVAMGKEFRRSGYASLGGMEQLKALLIERVVGMWS